MQPVVKNDEALIQKAKETWSLTIAQYAKENLDNMTARNVLAQRNIGASAEIDIVTTYDRTGPGAQIVAKGATPEKNNVKVNTDYHTMFQIATRFTVNAKDLKSDPKLKTRNIEIAMDDVHRAEDEFAIFGNSKYGVTGITGAAQANENGKIVASGASGNDVNNAGAWSGETGTDIYDDINTGIGMMEDEAKPAYLLGSRASLRKLYRLDSERTPYYKSIAPLFGKKNENDTSWMWETGQPLGNKVYILPKNFRYGEFVVSENPRLVSYAMESGENYPFEIISWSGVEIHSNEGYVEIDVS